MGQEFSLQFEFVTTMAPVQAIGTVAGRPFYFRARYDARTFAVAEADGVDPVDLDSPEAVAGRGWFREGQVGERGEYAASYLSAEAAARLIRRCAAAYIADRGPSSE